ncbi:Gamma-glutamyltranspeptidase 1 [Striga hermonthica]|uniref:Glutathione hydrolase n=1 Tax=Striga hermonthica TaxID=68872 RepID=A0A9N7MWW3_STRHE|nr:Gamma-glutamyltranspeptidase 1 [Striga hermonthica]
MLTRLMSFRCAMFRLVLLLPLLCSTFLLKSLGDASRPERVEAKNGVVATDETACSRIGRDLLKQGGHAVDAAVGATLCIGVVSPAESGLGGGGFILVRQADGQAKVYDMREIAPGRASKDMFANMTELEWKVNPLSIAVPGQLAGLYTVQQKYGKLPWASVVKPCEDLARNAFKISRALSRKIASVGPHILSDESFGSVFAPNGQILVEGQTLRLRKLADTLAAIGKHGMGIFYNGSIADGLVKDIRKRKGIVTKEDFQKYRVITREPLVSSVLGYNLLTVPPPASGGAVVILILKTLSKFDNNVTTSLFVHRTIEALKYALALRMNLGDPGFVNITNIVNYMTADSTAQKIKNLIDDKKTFDPVHYGSRWSQVDDHGTNHLCIIDRERNVVTMTTSINTRFGSKIMSESTGIFFNNQMYDFSIPTSKGKPGAPANYVSPYKRPLSSLEPIILLKGGCVRAVIGSAGGLLIPDSVSQTLLNFFVRKKHIFTSVKTPRFYHRLYPNVLLHENYSSVNSDHYVYTDKTLSDLKKRGHHLRQATAMMTTCQFVVQTLIGNKTGLLTAVSDLRKGGFPAGY